MTHKWLVTYIPNIFSEMMGEEGEVILEAPCLWDVSKVLQDLHPGVVVKGVAWIMPELELEEE
jgi:hypothetical protein